MVRPPTARTRRKQLKLVAQLPLHLVQEFLRPLQPEDAQGVVRDANGNLEPTKQSAGLLRFSYTIRKGSVSDRLFAFQNFDLQSRLGKSKRPRAAKPPAYAFKRGSGAARLQLKRAAQKRGEMARLVSMIVGNVIVNVKVPKHLGAMPTITLLLFVATMDETGHVNWPTNFDPRAKAALRKQFVAQLQTMLADDAYPTASAMQHALTGGGDSVRTPPPQRRLLALPAPATTA